MASAVLASRNEAHWGERKVYMRDYTKTPIPINHNNLPHFNRNPNPNPSPSPNFNHGRQHIHEHAAKPNSRPNNEPSPAAEFHRKPITGIDHNDAFHREYVTFNLSMYTQNDIKELKTRLVLELEKVQSLLNRIQTREIEPRPGFQAPRPHACDPVVTQPELPLQKVEFATTKGKNQSKNKKVSGQKRANANLCPSGRDVKRPAVVEADKTVAVMMNKCKQILTKIMKNKAAWWFNTPVDVDGMKLFDYYQVIKTPMDLGSVKSKLEKNGYETPESFATDVRLTFTNAMVYNPKGHSVHTTAEKFLSMFDQMFKKFEAEYNNSVKAKAVDVEVRQTKKSFVKSMPRGVKKNADQLNKPVLGKLAKPKRAMTYEEKEMLGLSLEELQQEKGEQMLQIVRKRSRNLMQDGDEIELDIESLDDETLWELDRFVTYHKKEMMKRQELFQNVKSPVPVHDDAIPEKNKKGDVGEEDVDIGEEIPVGNFPPVEIERDVSSSSSSSSSGSSSSSSGSDSGSSSGSDGEDSVQSPFIDV